MLNILYILLTKKELQKIKYLYHQYYFADDTSKIKVGRLRKKYFKYLNKLFSKYQKYLIT